MQVPLKLRFRQLRVVLGAFQRAVAQDQVQLYQGDRFLLFIDGLIEALDQGGGAWRATPGGVIALESDNNSSRGIS